MNQANIFYTIWEELILNIFRRNVYIQKIILSHMY